MWSKKFCTSNRFCSSGILKLRVLEIFVIKTGFTSKSGGRSHFRAKNHFCISGELFKADLLLLMHEPPQMDRFAVIRRRIRDFRHLHTLDGHIGDPLKNIYPPPRKKVLMKYFFKPKAPKKIFHQNFFSWGGGYLGFKLGSCQTSKHIIYN